MKKVVVVLVTFLSLYAYPQKDYKGIILDASTKECIPYVNIGILKKGLGTVSDEKGIFHLELNPSEFTQKDILIISSIGYEPIEIPVPQLEFRYNEYPEIYMQPKVEQLNEVVLTNAGAFQREGYLGYQNGGERTFGYWKDNIALGGELGTRIKINKGLRKLEEFQFEVWGNTADSVLVRVNFYELDKIKGLPGKNLNRTGKNILYTIKALPEVVRLPIGNFDIYVKDDFVVTLELLKVYGSDKIGLVLAASNFSYTNSYKKYASQDKWELIEKAAMAYEIRCMAFTDKAVDKKTWKRRKAHKKASISGFVFKSGVPQAGIRVTNLTNGQSTVTNSKGRYEIMAKKGHLLRIYAAGASNKVYKVLKSKFINLNL